MWSLKAEHKFTDRWSLSGFYVYNSTTEPATESMPASHDYMDGAYDLLERRPHLLVFNNTNILNDTTIPDAALRLDDVDGPERARALPGGSCLARVQPELRQRRPSGRSRPVSGSQFRRGPRRGPLGRNAAAVEGTLYQRRAVEADGRPPGQGGSRPARLGIDDPSTRTQATSPSAVPSQPAGCRQQQPRAERPWGCQGWKGGLRPRGASSGTRNLGRLRPGRLAREPRASH